jgi:hypothetical protein
MDTCDAVLKLLAEAVKPHELVVDRLEADDEMFLSVPMALERKLWAEINHNRVQFRVLPDGRSWVESVVEQGNDNVIAFQARTGEARNSWELDSECTIAEAIERAADWLTAVVH